MLWRIGGSRALDAVGAHRYNVGLCGGALEAVEQGAICAFIAFLR